MFTQIKYILIVVLQIKPGSELLRQRMNVKSHTFQITQNPGKWGNDARSMYTRNSARINQRGMTAFYVCKTDYLSNVTMPAADKIVISRAGHTASVMRIVGDKNAPIAHLQYRIHPMVN